MKLVKTAKCTSPKTWPLNLVSNVEFIESIYLNRFSLNLVSGHEFSDCLKNHNGNVVLWRIIFTHNTFKESRASVNFNTKRCTSYWTSQHNNCQDEWRTTFFSGVKTAINTHVKIELHNTNTHVNIVSHLTKKRKSCCNSHWNGCESIVAATERTRTVAGVKSKRIHQ